MSAAYRSYSSIAAIAIVCIVAGGQMASGQAPDQPAVKDTIFARKILMGAIDRNMDEVETMLAPGGKLDSADAREYTDTISVMLMSFPHLFPPASNQWKPDVNRDPATDTFAAPELWSNFSDFYSRATAASKVALLLTSTYADPFGACRVRPVTATHDLSRSSRDQRLRGLS